MHAEPVFGTHVDADTCAVYTTHFIFTCVKLVYVRTNLATWPTVPDDSLVVCDATLTGPTEAGKKSAPHASVPSVYQQGYWGAVGWQQGPSANKQCSPLSFGDLVLTQTAMSAAGISLSMHGCAAVALGSNADAKHVWLFCEGIVLTQPWVRELLVTSLLRKEAWGQVVGIICLTRPEIILSNMSLEQARWVAKRSSQLQSALDRCFVAAVHRGFVHLAADQPANVAIVNTCPSSFRVYLLNWSRCAQRILLKEADVPDLMPLLLALTEGAVAAALKPE